MGWGLPAAYPDGNEGKDGARSLKINRGYSTIHGGPFAGSYRLPDKDWLIEMEVEVLGDKKYRMSPKKRLKRGEYGFHLAIGYGKEGGALYSFAVD